MLFSVKKPSTLDETIAAKIKQMRLSILLHSYLYYEKNVNIISDARWSEIAHELAKMQIDYPNVSKAVRFYEMFKDWKGDSGANLQYDDALISKAYHLCNYLGIALDN